MSHWRKWKNENKKYSSPCSFNRSAAGQRSVWASSMVSSTTVRFISLKPRTRLSTNTSARNDLSSKPENSTRSSTLRQSIVQVILLFIPCFGAQMRDSMEMLDSHHMVLDYSSCDRCRQPQLRHREVHCPLGISRQAINA
jgi:hypothetical protein